MKFVKILPILCLWGLSAGCSGAFWGGTASGAGGTGVAYEAHAKMQLDRINRDLEKGVIDQREYDIRKDQIKRMSIVY